MEEYLRQREIEREREEQEHKVKLMKMREMVAANRRLREEKEDGPQDRQEEPEKPSG